MKDLVRRFWWNTGSTFLLCALILHFWWAPYLRRLPPAPFPFSRTIYLNSYNDEGILSHYLYWFGLFGFGEKLRHSDLILIGTSHVWFGLSASLLSEKLSAAEGRPVHVMNMGLGYADEAFQFRALRHNHINGKTIILDLYSPAADTMSVWAMELQNKDWLVAYFLILKIWSEAIRDWCLDSILPRFNAQGNAPHLPRYYVGAETCRWDTNDLEYMWNPIYGYIYRRGSHAGNDRGAFLGKR
jgi:hypothetical protein